MSRRQSDGGGGARRATAVGPGPRATLTARVAFEEKEAFPGPAGRRWWPSETRKGETQMVLGRGATGNVSRPRPEGGLGMTPRRPYGAVGGLFLREQ
jgi:hypothetical protein